MKPTAAPTRFDLQPFGNRWFSWSEVHRCFWPRAAGFSRSEDAHAELAPVVHLGGIYILAWSPQPLPKPSPSHPKVHYIGETNWFKRRLAQFGDSAGLFGERRAGHSAGWRWRLGTRNLRVAFFPVRARLDRDHLAVGLRKWMEALAIESHRQAQGAIPYINQLVPDE